MGKTIFSILKKGVFLKSDESNIAQSEKEPFAIISAWLHF